MQPLLKLAIKVIINWLPFGITVTLTAFLVYGAVQQSYRSNANDPQIQISEDLAGRLSEGADPSALLAGVTNIDISKSLAPFAVIFDNAGNIVASSGNLHGNKMPSPPPGVLENAKTNGQNRLTWQPEPKVRVAIVVTYFKIGTDTNGFILAGRSLREIELREKNLVLQVFMWWGIALITTIIASSMLTITKQS